MSVQRRVGWASIICFVPTLLAAFGWGRHWPAEVNIVLTLGCLVCWATLIVGVRSLDLGPDVVEAARRVVAESYQTHQPEVVPNEWSYGPVIVVNPHAWFALRDAAGAGSRVPGFAASLAEADADLAAGRVKRLDELDG